MDITRGEAFLILESWMSEQAKVRLLHRTDAGRTKTSATGTIFAADESFGVSIRLIGEAGTFSFESKEGRWIYADMREAEDTPEWRAQARDQGLEDAPLLGLYWPSGEFVSLVLPNPRNSEEIPRG